MLEVFKNRFGYNTMSDIIQSLWIGGELSLMEQLSAKSFIDHGHEYHLYTYGDVKNIPEGVIVKDGNEILPESEIFRYENGSVSAFSNYFRFMMLYKKGGYWADSDLICVKPFTFEEEYVIAREPVLRYEGRHVTSCFIKLPKNSAVTLSAINIQKAHKKLILSGQMKWSSGPKTIKAIVEKHNLQKYILPWNNVCSCAWNHGMSIVNPDIKPDRRVISRMNEIPDKMVAIHLWNEMWRRQGINKNDTFHPESLYEQLKKKHNI